MLDQNRFADYHSSYTTDGIYPDHFSFYYDVEEETNERIFDFHSPTWPEEYQQLKNTIDLQVSEYVIHFVWLLQYRMTDEYYDQLWEEYEVIWIIPTYRSNGYSRIIDTPSYAIVTNVCVNTKDAFITLHLQDDRVLSNLLTEYNRKVFIVLLPLIPHS